MPRKPEKQGKHVADPTMVREAGSVIIKTGYTLPETNSEFFPEHQGGWKMKFPNSAG